MTKSPTRSSVHSFAPSCPRSTAATRWRCSDPRTPSPIYRHNDAGQVTKSIDPCQVWKRTTSTTRNQDDPNGDGNHTSAHTRRRREAASCRPRPWIQAASRIKEDYWIRRAGQRDRLLRPTRHTDGPRLQRVESRSEREASGEIDPSGQPSGPNACLDRGPGSTTTSPTTSSRKRTRIDDPGARVHGSSSAGYAVQSAMATTTSTRSASSPTRSSRPTSPVVARSSGSRPSSTTTARAR